MDLIINGFRELNYTISSERDRKKSKYFSTVNDTD